MVILTVVAFLFGILTLNGSLKDVGAY